MCESFVSELTRRPGSVRREPPSPAEPAAVRPPGTNTTVSLPVPQPHIRFLEPILVFFLSFFLNQQNHVQTKWLTFLLTFHRNGCTGKTQ